MKILAVEASTGLLSLAVIDDRTILRYRNINLGRRLCSQLVPEVNRILGKAGIPLSDIEGFAVGLGPGSFTSLRVTVAAVKAFAFALGKPIVGVSSLDILAMSVLEEDVRICAISDAKRNLLYAGFYHKRQGCLNREGRYLLIGRDELLKKITHNTIFVGDGILLLKRWLTDINIGVAIRFADEKFWKPSARCLAILARERFNKQDYDNPSKLRPLYLYSADCQVRG